MEKDELGDELGSSYLTEQKFIIHSDDLDEDGDPLELAAENTDDSSHDEHKLGAPLREQDRFLPIANVAKIMKRAIPESGKIAKDARECVQECVSEFISFITAEASDRCHTEKRKTINGEDILYAMSMLGFDNYVEPLKVYLQKFRDASKTDKNLQTSDMSYDEDDAFNAIGGTLMPTEGVDTVIYSYQDNNIHQFQLP